MSAGTIVYRLLSGLKPDPRNPKRHDVDTIIASIARFGFLDPVVEDGRTGYVISGHGRLEALQLMEVALYKLPTGVQVNGATRCWKVPVVVGWSSANDAEAAAALIALNRTVELGGWADEALLSLLDELSDSGEDALIGVGFTEEDRAALEALQQQVEESLGGGEEDEDPFEDLAPSKPSKKDPNALVIKGLDPEDVSAFFKVEGDTPAEKLLELLIYYPFPEDPEC